jgi:hypothetical protein
VVWTCLTDLRLPSKQWPVPPAAQIQAGEDPWNPLRPCSVAPTVVENTELPDTFTAPFLRAAVVLVVSVDLSGVAAMDQDLDRIGVVSGASVYPLVWTSCWAPATRVTCGTLTTMAVPEKALSAAAQSFARLVTNRDDSG